MMKKSIFTYTAQYGVFMGICFCLYTTLMWLTKLDTTYLSVGQYFDIAIIILPVTIIFLVIIKINNFYRITIFQRIIVAIGVGAISYLIYDPFLYIYHHYINPTWFDAVLNLKENELKLANNAREKIIETLQMMKKTNIAQSGFYRLATLIPSVIIIPTLVALISILFIKRNKLKNYS